MERRGERREASRRRDSGRRERALPRVSRFLLSTQHQDRGVAQGGRSRGPQPYRARLRFGSAGPIGAKHGEEGTRFEAPAENRHVKFNNFHYGTSREGEKYDRLPQFSKNFHKKSENSTKSFRDLFSAEDIERGGDWEEVRRRRAQRRSRDRSPLIKNPCFRCGLGGHIRRFCPQRHNMRCYGCNATTHLIRHCLTTSRPEETAIEFKDSVFDVDDRVKTLNKFAIFRTLEGTPNEHTLRAAVDERFWEYNWKGNIIPIGNGSFLVGFVNEFRRDLAVREGKVDFGEFKGKFYAWGESLGAAKVYRPVFLWVKLVGLPLQCWGEEEVKSLVSSFGKPIQISENLYTKSSADVVRVMVEVEDISVVPKVVKCSYKAISDNIIRIFNVSILPSSQCLPVSMLNEANYKLFEEGGGLSETVEERWSNGSAAAPFGVQGVGRKLEGTDVRADMEPEVADLPPENKEVDAPSVAAATGVQRDLLQIHAPRASSQAEDAERRRKGKAVLDLGQDVDWANKLLRPTNYSGSDSCDPMDQEAHHWRTAGPEASTDADSCAGPAFGPLTRPMETQKEQQGERQVEEGIEIEKPGGVESAAIKEPLVEEVVVRKDAGEKGKSKASSLSVPPGYARLEKQKSRASSGAASPFGQFQKGAFKLIRRTPTATASLKSGNSLPLKRIKPFSVMPNSEFEEVARNVGIKLPLNDEQIAFLKSLEKDRASS